MDIGTSSSQKKPLRSSDAFVWFFITRIMKDQGDRKNTSWAWLKADWSPLKNVAHKRNWQRKLKSAEEQGESTLHEFINDQILEQAPDLCERFKNSPSTSTEVMWNCFKNYVTGFHDKAAGHPSGIVLDYCLSQSERPMDFVEAALWMLIAYQEFTLVSQKNALGAGDSPNTPGITFDPLKWVPINSTEGLTSTRYQIVDILISHPAFKKLGNDCKRTLQAQRGARYLNPGDKLPPALSVNTINSKLDLKEIGFSVGAEETHQQEFREHLCGLLHLAGFFGFIQFNQLQSGIEPENIVNQFENIISIKADFYEELMAYSQRS